jgi:HSP20 family protein
MIRQTPFLDILSAFDTLDRASTSSARSGRTRVSAPRASSTVRTGMPIDCYASSDHAVVLASLPGIHPDDVSVSVEDDTLTITGSVTGERKQQDEHGEAVTWYMAEIQRGSYERRIRLPFPIEESKVEAQFSHGLLRIKLPKQEAAKPRRIPVQVLEQRFAEIAADSDDGQSESVKDTDTDPDSPTAD